VSARKVDPLPPQYDDARKKNVIFPEGARLKLGEKVHDRAAILKQRFKEEVGKINPPQKTKTAIKGNSSLSKETDESAANQAKVSPKSLKLQIGAEKSVVTGSGGSGSKSVSSPPFSLSLAPGALSALFNRTPIAINTPPVTTPVSVRGNLSTSLLDGGKMSNVDDVNGEGVDNSAFVSSSASVRFATDLEVATTVESFVAAPKPNPNPESTIASPSSITPTSARPWKEIQSKTLVQATDSVAGATGASSKVLINTEMHPMR